MEVLRGIRARELVPQKEKEIGADPGTNRK